MHIIRRTVQSTLCALLAACGLSETATTAAVVTGAQSRQADQAKQQLEQVRQQVNAATQQAQAQKEVIDEAVK